MRMLIGLLVVCASGCVLWPSVESPKTGAAATGQPLRIIDDVKVSSYVSRDKVAEIRYEDSSGESLGRSDVYANRQHTTAEMVWFPVQGYEVIDDADFFRIAGDQKSLDRTLERRAKLKRWNHRGKATALAGVAAVALSFVVGNPARTLLVLSGGLAVSAGWYLSLWTHQQMKPEYHAVDRMTAGLAAEQFNDTHGLSASRSF